jgi:hypothetical protein
MALVNDCVCGSDCLLKAKCDSQHKCVRCDGFLHAICGHPVDETDPKWSICYSRICNGCYGGTVATAAVATAPPNNNDPDSNSEDDLTLAEFAKKRAAMAAAAEKKQAPTKKKRAPRPVETYHDDPTADATNWTFPVDRPEYLSTFVEFMSFIDNKQYTKTSNFTKANLMLLQPKHVLAFLTHKAFGKTRREPDDKPEYARSNHIKNMKMKLSHFMPSGAPWVDLPDGTGHGNPTRHKSINKLIGDIIQYEIRGEGAEGKDVRDMTMLEVEKELELFRRNEDPTCRYRNPLIGIYQYQFITRCDDVCNFKVDDPKGNAQFECALSQSVKWSKNVKDSRNCPDQLLLGAGNHNHCIFLALALWLEYFLRNHPDATYLMSPGIPRGKSEKEHKKFMHAISKTYRNQWTRIVVKNNEFTSIYKGRDKRPLGLHSK